MKKLVFAFMAIIAISLVSCDTHSDNKGNNDQQDSIATVVDPQATDSVTAAPEVAPEAAAPEKAEAPETPEAEQTK